MVESEVHFLRFLADTELRSGHCGRASGSWSLMISQRNRADPAPLWWQAT